ncbi:hypothetical protein AOLI_G00124280 [Acnodon oligacanthus]
MAGYGHIGHIDAFDENVEQWTTYVERFEHFVKANDIEEDKKLAMDQVLQGLSNVHCYLYDILITGQNRVQHLKNLDAVLGHLEEFGLRIEKEKCEFFKDSLEYLGHTINAHGLHKSPEKVRAIVEAPAPTDPYVTSEVDKAQEVQCTRREIHAKARSFKVGDKVLVRDYRRGEKWTLGVVSAETGPVSYTVNIGSSEHWRRHADQMLARHAELNASANGEPTSSYAPAELPVLENTMPKPATHPSPEPVSVSSPQVTSEETNTQPQETASAS